MRMLRNPSSMDDFFGDFFRTPAIPAKEIFTPSCDIEETKDDFLLSLDMPGFKEDDIKVEVKDDTLTIWGERNREVKDTENENYVRYERSYGKFQRSFSLPRNVNSQKIAARYINGVLSVAIPKAEVSTGHKIEIQSGNS